MEASISNQELLRIHFPGLQQTQQDMLLALVEQYEYWNQRINVVSRKDIDNLFLHHIIHSLALSYFADFSGGLKLIDAGTGGGFPGLPLAIMFPDSEFYLVDSTAKKLNVVDEITSALGIENVTTFHIRLEDLRIENDAIISRAVSSLPVFSTWVRHLVTPGGSRHQGIYYLKGGDVENEALESGLSYAIHDLAEKLPYDYFTTKKLVHLLP